MAQYTLPTLGETASQGIIAKVLVAVGDSVSEDQSVLELETDKAVLEVPSTVAGIIQKVLVKQGDTVKVDQPIFEYESGTGSNGTAESAASTAQSNGVPSATPPVPQNTTTSSNGQPEQTAASEAKIGQTDGEGDAESGAPASNKAPAPSAPTPNVVKDPTPAAPSVRRQAREMGVDIHQVKGSGPGGRISSDDILQFVKTAHTPSASSAPQATPLPDFSKQGQIERIAMSGIRRATSTQMGRAWTIPHVTQFDKADTTEFDLFRKKYGALAEKAGAKLTPTAILVKIVVGALKKFPNFNASLDLEANEIVQKRFYNIGVAVDTPRGLVVPVIKNADAKGIIELAVELGELAARARDGKLKPEEMTGGTFTLTNLGGIGGTAFTPIVNTPEVAILGIARGTIEPVWNKETNSFEPRMMMPLCLSYDHRVIDGADGARFTRFIAAALEDPNLIALQG